MAMPPQIGGELPLYLVVVVLYVFTFYTQVVRTSKMDTLVYCNKRIVINEYYR